MTVFYVAYCTLLWVVQLIQYSKHYGIYGACDAFFLSLSVNGLNSKINKQKSDTLLCKQNIAMFALNYPFCLDIPLVWLENGSGNLFSIWCEGQLWSHSFSLSEYGHPQIKSNYTGTQSTEWRILIQQRIVSRLECMTLGCSRDAHLSTVSPCSNGQRKIN